MEWTFRPGRFLYSMAVVAVAYSLVGWTGVGIAAAASLDVTIRNAWWFKRSILLPSYRVWPVLDTEPGGPYTVHRWHCFYWLGKSWRKRGRMTHQTAEWDPDWHTHR